MTPDSHHPAQLRGLALATLFPGFEGSAEPPEWLIRLAREGLGGVILFGRNVAAEGGDGGVAALVAALHDAAPNLLVGIDEEGGDVTRLDVGTGSSVPGNAALGAVDDVGLTRDVAAELGARLRRCGIDMNFAPVADVDVHPDNPVIGVRAFGFDADLVARHVEAFVAGQQSQRVAAAAKHFPGHGGTAEDSHLTVPELPVSRDLMQVRELAPFRAAIAAGAKIVMTAHIRVPAIDPASPATLSPALITGVLRGELGYRGVVMTDGLDMHAISRTIGHPEAAVQALAAGVDALCVGGDSTDPDVVEAIVAALIAAVDSGRLPFRRLAEAAGRVRDLAHWSRGPVTGAAPTGAALRAAHAAVSAHGAVALEAAPLVLELDDEPSVAAGAVPWGVGAPLAAAMAGTVVVRIADGGPAVGRALREFPGRPVVVAIRGARRRPWQARLLAAIRAARSDVVVVDHGVATPRDILGERYVLAYGAARVTAEAAAELLASDHAEIPVRWSSVRRDQAAR